MVKISQEDEGAKCYFQNEFEMLGIIRSRVSNPDVLSSVPQVWCCQEMEGHQVLIESFMQGEKYRGRRADPRLFKRSLSWLVQFHRSLSIREKLADEDVQNYFLAPIDEFLYHAGPSQDVKVYLLDMRRELGSWLGRDLSLVLNHNDFSFANILFYKSGLSVLDWEFAAYPSLPLFDFIHHCFRYLRIYRALRRGGVVHIREFDGAGVIRELLPHYMKALDLSEHDLLPLTAAYFVGRFAHARSMAMTESVEMLHQGLLALSRGNLRW